jgi:hypothetical protein
MLLVAVVWIILDWLSAAAIAQQLAERKHSPCFRRSSAFNHHYRR